MFLILNILVNLAYTVNMGEKLKIFQSLKFRGLFVDEFVSV